MNLKVVKNNGDTIEADLIICNHTNNERWLKCFKGDDSRYFCGPNETRKHVLVKRASIEMLKQELAKLSILIDDENSINIVAEKFRKELVSIKGGKLAYSSEKSRHGFYEILKIYKR